MPKFFLPYITGQCSRWERKNNMLLHLILTNISKTQTLLLILWALLKKHSQSSYLSITVLSISRWVKIKRLNILLFNSADRIVVKRTATMLITMPQHLVRRLRHFSSWLSMDLHGKTNCYWCSRNWILYWQHWLFWD